MVAVVELIKVVQQVVEDQVVEVTQVLVVVITLEVQVGLTLEAEVVELLINLLKQLVEQGDQVL